MSRARRPTGASSSGRWSPRAWTPEPRLPADRDAEEQSGRLRHRLLRHHRRLLADLAHLVAGGRGLRSAPTPASWSSPGATCNEFEVPVEEVARDRPRPPRRRARRCSTSVAEAGGARPPMTEHADIPASLEAIRARPRATRTASATARTRPRADPGHRPRRDRPGAASGSSSPTASGSSCSATS